MPCTRRAKEATCPLAWTTTTRSLRFRADRLRGLWRGSGEPTGHRLDGVLEQLGWFGKRFEDDERVHPLVFRTGVA